MFKSGCELLFSFLHYINASCNFQFCFITGPCHKEITWEMRAHLRFQLLVNLQCIWSYIDHFYCFYWNFQESSVKQTICTGAISCYRMLLNLDLTDSSRIQNSGWLRVDTILENGGKTLIGRESGKSWILGIIGKRRQRHTPSWRWCEQLSPKDNSCHFSKCQWLFGIDTVEDQWQHVSISVCELDAGNPCSICQWPEIL